MEKKCFGKSTSLVATSFFPIILDNRRGLGWVGCEEISLTLPVNVAKECADAWSAREMC